MTLADMDAGLVFVYTLHFVRLFAASPALYPYGIPEHYHV